MSASTTMDSEKPYLGVYHKSQIKEIRALTEEEYKDYMKAASKLRQYVSDQQLFAIAYLNCVDFRRLLRQSFQQYVAKSPLPMDVLNLHVNRSLLNFLSAFRTFLDHSEFNLKRRYGHDHERVQEYKSARSNEYDNCFSYRFIYQLRNYTQHCGMPLGELSFESKLEDDKVNRITHSLSVYFKRDNLLSSEFDWGSELRREIQALPARFEITPHVVQAVECLKRINMTMIKNDSEELRRSAQIVRNLIAPLEHEFGKPCILFMAKDASSLPDSLKVRIHEMPLHILALVS